MTDKKRPAWIRDKILHKEFEIIECVPYDTYKDFTLDKGCYVLIKVDFEYHELQVAITNYEHEILKVFKGKRAQDVYHAIFEYEKQHKQEWFTQKEHVAYLGKELKKAEIALALGNTGYYQE
ncbi:hypothetical protein COT72_00980 [archaeon CG10_big_fil_rev_8_21_14_0_10_43_11]|nr:MAG: hypothetical protein COT72_00980 [archaeon CG10_big_fil_rev_8_21_14_0_10_43_11]